MAIYSGYPATIFQTCWLSLQWLSGILAGGAAKPVLVASAAEATYATLLNGAEAIGAQQLLSGWQEDFARLQEIQALPLTLDSQTQDVFDARVGTYAAAIPQISALLPAPNPVIATQLLTAGKPAITYPGLTEYLCNSQTETPPAGFNAGAMTAFLLVEIAAWLEVATQVRSVQGAQVTQAFDAAIRQYGVVNQIYTDFNGFTSGPFSQVPTPNFTWNQMCVVPSMMRSAEILMSAPYSMQNQQGGVIRYILRTMADQIAMLLLSLRKPSFGQASTASLMHGDSLMDFAARNLGDFERWRDVAALNGLQPPYVGAVGEPGIAQWGTQILLPTTTGVPPASGLPTPNYAANVLGIDLFLGRPGWPIGQPMPPWNGDFQLATGYDNLRLSLARRILTTRGSLVFHQEYGSRIPPEVGAVQDSSTAGHIAAYGQSALASDPRVASVISAKAAIPAGGKGLVEFSAQVRPIGLDQSPVLVNETLNPLP